MRSPLLIILAPFVLLVILVNSPLRDSFVTSSADRPTAWRTGQPLDRWRTPAEDRAAQRSTSLARTWAGRTQGRLDSPMSAIQSQMASSGASPSLSRSGRYRTFTYRFRDGSVLEFTAVPAGGQTGLILYSVDIRN